MIITKKKFKELPDFPSYYQLSLDLFAKGKTTGANQNEAYLHYTKLSLARTKRGLKTLFPSDELKSTAANSSRKNWLLITEAWCGDAGNIVPMIANLAEAIKEVDLRIALRDEHPEIMDHFLTNGSRSIPIFVAMNSDMEYASHWGPRPRPAQKMVMNNKNNPQVSTEEFQVQLQKWYLEDRGATLDKELVEYLKL
ncbi:thioredoxin family protein [Parvicella tangerina]|uniref:Thioredoxin family protein n=1 Tax=Parvicella tangerina TaxID=2829795 RepID=A0A916JLI1_9FLAO|nr:thioredoxin family protein [Parvicella tangerina]CAG5080346.1 hypothetical protein CRYO30217_01266 [Parvicella tangerina]